MTSFLFQHNFCQCTAVKQRKPIEHAQSVQPQSVQPICKVCGKAKSENKKAGSLTAYLFKELRCTCAETRVARADTKDGNSTSNRTLTAERLAQRSQFTEMLRGSSLSAKPVEMFEPESIVGGVFRIISVIGMGGMGVVYLAEHMALKSRFALKVLSPYLVNEQNWLRFMSEAKTIASLQTSHFCKSI